MKILFVIQSLPFPSRHGVELPIEMLASEFSKHGTVDILVVGSNENSRYDFQSRLIQVPEDIRHSIYLHVHYKRCKRALLMEFIGVRPSFLGHVDFNPASIDVLRKEVYDYVWVSPISGLNVLSKMSEYGAPLTGKVVVGLNDATYGLYMNGFRHLLKRPNRKEWRRILNAFRSPWIFMYERRYLKTIDAIHVQTDLEKRRVSRLFAFSKSRPMIISKQNGKRLPHQVDSGNTLSYPVVLFMTHLSRGRSQESRWFIDKVWPLVLQQKPDARLWLVGSPPDDPVAFSNSVPSNVEVLGYVDDLDVCLQKANIGVIPTLHNSGWVNRVSDYLQAGLPIVACKEPLQTVKLLRPGIHAECADTPTEFAAKVVALLDNPARAAALSDAGRSLATEFPTWEEMGAYIYTQLEELRKK